MTGFDRQYRASCGEVGSTHNVRCSSEVRADADALENRGGGDEALDVGDSAEVVCASCDWGRAGGGESRGQEADVGGLVEGDFLQIFVEGLAKLGGEVFLGEIGETLAVEGVF